jgi:hypothetical protein
VLNGGAGGIVLGFIWYEHKCGLLSDDTGQRASAIIGLNSMTSLSATPREPAIGATPHQDANLSVSVLFADATAAR